MRLTIEQKKEQYRTIYEAIWQTPRIFVKDLALLLDCTPTAATNRLKEAYDLGYIVGPDVRKKSCSNLKEYMYFINCEDPELSYLKYREDPNVIYHAKTSGFCNMWIIGRGMVNIEGDVILEGCHSDYNVSYAPDRTWDQALKIMEGKINTFNPDTYQPQGFIKTHFDETIDWDPEDEILFRHFKYNLRRNLKPVMKNHRISAEKVYNFLNNLQYTCTIATHYYPESLPFYDSYLFMFETDYEDFIIDLFSELPSSVSFFKVSNRLFLVVYVPWRITRRADLQAAANEIIIPLMMLNLRKKGIIKNKKYAIVEYFWGEEL